MSDDMVDDLHCAEDMIGSFLEAAKAIFEPGGQRTENFDALRQQVTYAEHYCRPTCGYLDEYTERLNEGAESDEAASHADDVCDDETCGCLCGHPGSLLDR